MENTITKKARLALETASLDSCDGGTQVISLLEAARSSLRNGGIDDLIRSLYDIRAEKHKEPLPVRRDEAEGSAARLAQVHRIL